MREIQLTQGKVALVDDDDFQRLSEFKWCANNVNGKWYAGRWQQIKLMHRFILGITDPHVTIDHKDGNGLNNQKDNLRICTQQQNTMNRRKPKPLTSKYKGVCFTDNRYKARVHFDGKNYYLGRFKNESDAAVAYNNKAKELFGEFAVLNEIQR